MTAKQLTDLGPEKAFYAILGVMEKIKSPAERSAIAVELFGKAGQGVVNLVARGVPGIKALGDEALRMGAAMNGIQNAKAMEAEEAMIKLGEAAKGFANLLVVEIAPYLTLVIDKYMEWAYSGERSANFIGKAMEWVATGIGLVIDAIEIGKTVFYSLGVIGGAAIMGLLMPLHAVDIAIGSIMEALTGKSSQSYFGMFWEELAKQVDDSAKKLEESVGRVGKGGETIRNMMADFRGKADARAKIKAEEANKFIEPGDIDPNAAGAKKHHNKDKMFGGAFEFGSKEAYSAILTSKGLQQGMDQRQIAENTRATAEAGKQGIVQLKAINEAVRQRGAAGVGGGLNKI